MKTIKLFDGTEVPVQIDVTQRVFQMLTYNGEYVLCNLEDAKQLIKNGIAESAKHIWNNEFKRIGKSEILQMG